MKSWKPSLGAPLSSVRASRSVRVWSYGFRWLWIILLFFLLLPGTALAAAVPAKLLRRLLAPFRSNPVLQISTGPCSVGFRDCFMSFEAVRPAISEFEPLPVVADPRRVVTMQIRSLHRGPFCHHWLELESSHGRVTMGFGPATVPFIDAGQISLRDAYGNTEVISGMHPFPVLGLPPVNYHYAKAPGAGRAVGKPVQLSIAQADGVIQRELHRKFVGPFVPIFHDCRTFACTVQARAQGRSSLPCYLLLKGHW